MAKFIINNLIYDTDRMKHVATVKKTYKSDNIFLKRLYGENVGQSYTCRMFKSSKGNFLLTREDSFATYGEAITETEAKQLMMKYDYKSYVQLYGALEEA